MQSSNRQSRPFGRRSSWASASLLAALGFAVGACSESAAEKLDRAEADVQQIYVDVERFQALNDYSFPTWDDLIGGQGGTKYIDADAPLLDPWGHPYEIRKAAGRPGDWPIIISYGPDGLPDTADDIKSKQ